jgi:uncharacterized membrane protein YphA (DoxX/SURF4 family)
VSPSESSPGAGREVAGTTGAAHSPIVLSVHTHQLQSDGLWLLAVGALLIVAALLAAGPPAGLDGMKQGVGRANERVAWALSLAAAVCVIVGSALLLVGNFPTDWVLWVSLVGVVTLLIAGWFASGSKSARKLPWWR